MSFGFSAFGTGAAVVAAPAGLVVSGLLVPSSVDRVSTTTAIGTTKVLATAQHANAIRIGYLAVVVALPCMGPATRRVTALAQERRRSLVDAGWHLVAIGATAGAVGNAYAPLILPSTVGFDPRVMGEFIHRHETSAASYAIIAVYILLVVGAALLLAGLLRARVMPWWAAIALAVPLGAILLVRIGPESIVDAVVLTLGLVVLHRGHLPARPA